MEARLITRHAFAASHALALDVAFFTAAHNDKR
jgi:hypothetical protein